ncbi:2Fe-2S iron-sulfur cluster binding domain-containing protein [Vibrio cholerae]|nr:2Fe-2S iron-sulfur cluster binding domain-containing protein [Vibrio cholerae]
MIFELSESTRTVLSLLDEEHVKLERQCKEGFCGMCRCTLLQGQVSYTTPPLAYLRAGEILACCSVPKTQVTIQTP